MRLEPLLATCVVVWGPVGYIPGFIGCMNKACRSSYGLLVLLESITHSYRSASVSLSLFTISSQCRPTRQLRMLPLLVLPICAKRFHRRCGGNTGTTQPALYRANMSVDRLVLTRQGVFRLIMQFQCVYFFDGCQPVLTRQGVFGLIILFLVCGVECLDGRQRNQSAVNRRICLERLQLYSPS